MNKSDETVKVVFPLMLRKDGKERKRQKNVYVGMNATVLCIKRGVEVDVPLWIPSVCDSANIPYQLVLQSNRRAEHQG